jgi:tetratricopeptide (TPR) repeat protein
LSCAADAHLRLGHYGAAKSRFRQAIDLVQQGGDIFLCARNLTRLGTAEQGEGNPSAAIALHLCARNLTRLGTAERSEGNPGAAIALHHQALLLQHQLLNPLTDPNYDWLEMDIRSRLGHAYLAAGRVHEARREFQTVLDVHRARVRRADRALGD